MQWTGGEHALRGVRCQAFILLSVVFFMRIQTNSIYTEMDKETVKHRLTRASDAHRLKDPKLHKRTFFTATLRTKIKLILHSSRTTNVADKKNGKFFFV